MIVGDQVEDVFFHVGARRTDRVDLILTDHFGEGEAQLSAAHGAGQGYEHFAILI